MKEKTFEENLSKLESIVNELEKGTAGLEKSIEKYSEAMKIAAVCGEKLNDATNQVNKILTENGTLENFAIEEEE